MTVVHEKEKSVDMDDIDTGVPHCTRKYVRLQPQVVTSIDIKQS